MYIKLTRFDNRPVWLNASFIVTVEPRRDGKGAVVVPIGDGLDYDVRETPEQVLAMLEGAPEPKVVPVPVSDCLTKTPDDVSPEPEPRREERPAPQPPKPVEKPVEQPVEQSAEKPAEQPAPEAAEEKPKRKTRAKAKAAGARKAKAEEKPAESEEKKDVAVPAAKPPVLELSDDEIVRLKKLAPKSVAKLKNTLVTQFHVTDAGGNVAALAEKGVFAIDGNRIIWPLPQQPEIADW